MKPKIKPRNPLVVPARFRKAGPHEKPAKSLRRKEKQTLAKTAKQGPESWHNRIQCGCGSAMAPAVRIRAAKPPFGRAIPNSGYRPEAVRRGRHRMAVIQTSNRRHVASDSFPY